MAFRSALVLPSFLSRRGLHTLVVADHNNLKLKDASLASIVAAGKIGGKVSVLVAGQGITLLHFLLFLFLFKIEFCNFFVFFRLL